MDIMPINGFYMDLSYKAHRVNACSDLSILCIYQCRIVLCFVVVYNV